MSISKKFFRNTSPERPSSYEGVSEAELERFFAVSRYGDFELTDAIRPSYDLHVMPQQGYRHDWHRDPEGGNRVPVLIAAVTREKLFEVFMDLIDHLGEAVDAVLETSHNQQRRGHTDLYREHIDLPVLKSILWEYEHLLTNDGCTGIAVLHPSTPQEVQFDEHKLLIVYGNELDAFEAVLQRHRIDCRDRMKFITGAEHVHSTSDRYARTFEELSTRLGLDNYAEDQGQH